METSANDDGILRHELRVTVGREPASPTTGNQRARRAAIIRCASARAADLGLDGVQMSDVAKDAGVALATLYRYFPSKTHLFVGVMADQVDVIRSGEVSPEGRSPSERVFNVLGEASDYLTEHPGLASAMIQSVSIADVSMGSELERIQLGMRDVLIRAIGDSTPVDDQAIRLVLHVWSSLLQGSIHGRASIEERDSDLLRACTALFPTGETLD